jgi:hypothetical protein
MDFQRIFIFMGLAVTGYMLILGLATGLWSKRPCRQRNLRISGFGKSLCSAAGDASTGRERCP